MGNLLPILVEHSLFMKVRIVVEIMALQTLRTCIRQGQAHLFAIGLDEFIRQIVQLAIFGSDMCTAWPVTVFATIPMHRDRLLKVEISRIIGDKLLRIPTGYVATDAFGIIMPRNLGTFIGIRNRHRCMMVGRCQPFFIGLRVAITTGFGADILSSTRMAYGGQAEPL